MVFLNSRTNAAYINLGKIPTFSLFWESVPYPLRNKQIWKCLPSEVRSDYSGEMKYQECAFFCTKGSLIISSFSDPSNLSPSTYSHLRFLSPVLRQAKGISVDFLAEAADIVSDLQITWLQLVFLAPHSGALVCECFSDPIPSIHTPVELCVFPSSLMSF